MTSEQEFQKLLKNLKRLPVKLNKGIVNLSVRAGAKTIQEAAKSNIPASLDDGKHSPKKVHSADDLRDSIVIKKQTIREKRRAGIDRDDNAYTIGIKLNQGKGWFAHFFEFGSELHDRKPFMTPAYEQNGTSAITASRVYIKRRFDAAVKKGLLK